MIASNLGNVRATCAVTPFAKPALLARPTRRTFVCKAAQGSNETLRKLAGAAAAAQIALLPFAGSALAEPQFDLAVDLPNPLELAQGAKGKADNALPNPNNGDGIPSNGNAAAQQDPVGDREALLAKMESTEGPDDAVRGGASGRPRAATGDLALGDIGDIVGKAKDAASGSSKGDSPLTPGEIGLPKPPSLEETKKAVEEVASGYDTGLKKAARSGGKNISATRATGDVSLGVEDVIGKAKDAASGSSKGDSPLTSGEINLPGPAPSLEETKKAAADVAAGGGGLKEASASRVGDGLGLRVHKAAEKAKEIASKTTENVKEAAPTPDVTLGGVLSKAANANGGIELPGPRAGDRIFPDLKSAVASRGANISRTGDALPDGLKPGQYKPT